MRKLSPLLIVALVALVVVFAGCQKRTRDYAGKEKPAATPAYKTEAQQVVTK